MNKLPIVATLMLTAAAFGFVPEAEAAGWCTSLLNPVTYPDCPALFCYGYWWSYPDPYVTCQHQFPPPCCPWLP